MVGAVTMQSNTSDPNNRTAYRVWDRTTRWFHWINALCVIGLAMLGLAILNEKSFGVSADGKVLLKTLHAYVGYVFVINLTWPGTGRFLRGMLASGFWEQVYADGTSSLLLSVMDLTVCLRKIIPLRLTHSTFHHVLRLGPGNNP